MYAIEDKERGRKSGGMYRFKWSLMIFRFGYALHILLT
jgi:hypothetical protein